MSKKIKFLILLIMALILSAAIYFNFFRQKAVEVEAATVKRGEFIEEILADGFFRAKNRYTVTAFAEGDIKRVDLRAGDVLKKGQPITELFWDVRYVPVRSPINGVITKVFRESAGPVHRGDPIIEVVDPNDLEIVAELLTTDAARVKVGNLAIASGWGEGKTINTQVSKISKAGFVKISALGVEEERTEVIMYPEKQSISELGKLGHTFHTQLVIQVSQLDSVLKIPTGALIRDGSFWAVYKIENNKARLQHVTPSVRGNEEVVITGGLREGDTVINYPGDLVKDGVAVREK